MRLCESDYTSKIHDVLINGAQFYIFTEIFYDNFQKIIEKQKGKFSENFCKYTIYSLVKGLTMFHKHNVILNGLTPENI